METADHVIFLFVLPGFPGERDTLINLYQSYVVVIELSYISVSKGSGVIVGMHNHRLGSYSAALWKPKRVLCYFNRFQKKA